MAIKDWKSDWRVPVLTQDMSTDKEVDARQDQIPAGDEYIPNNPKTI
jgi:hypothetical protein